MIKIIYTELFRLISYSRFAVRLFNRDILFFIYITQCKILSSYPIFIVPYIKQGGQLTTTVILLRLLASCVYFAHISKLHTFLALSFSFLIISRIDPI